MPQGKKHFWEGLPAILTAAAALVTAIGGVLALFIRSNNPAAVAPVEPANAVASAGETADEPPAQKRPRVPRVATARAVNLSGTWRDAVVGTIVRVRQSGNSLQTVTLNAAGQQVAAGEGVIEGRTIIGTNRWMNGAVYAARMTVSSDGNTITGTYSNPISGETGVVRLVR